MIEWSVRRGGGRSPSVHPVDEPALRPVDGDASDGADEPGLPPHGGAQRLLVDGAATVARLADAGEEAASFLREARGERLEPEAHFHVQDPIRLLFEVPRSVLFAEAAMDEGRMRREAPMERDRVKRLITRRDAVNLLVEDPLSGSARQGRKVNHAQAVQELRREPALQVARCGAAPAGPAPRGAVPDRITAHLLLAVSQVGRVGKDGRGEAE